MKGAPRMTIYMNNCHGINHAALYEKKDAFYDLYTTGPQPKNLSVGQVCVVASRTKDKQVTFRWFSFERTAEGKYEGRPTNVFCGRFIRKLGPFSQAEAARVVPTFFNTLGSFNQWNTLER
jgi:hypothetical protein